MANYLDPYAAELQGIQRQQKLAEMLMNQQQPQEQMVSGRVAPINPLQAFLPALNTYQGMNLQKNAEADTKKLADLVRGETNTKNEEIINAMLGKDYQPAIAPEIQRDDMGNVMPNVQEQSGMKADPRLALALALKSGTQFGEGLAPTLLTQLTKPNERVKLAQGESYGEVDKSGAFKPIYTNPAKEEKPPVSYQEYQLAKKEGFNGSYNDYQYLEANRRRPITNINTGNVGAEGEGGFDKKGNFISPNGTPFSPAELRKDREVLTSAALLKKALNNINPTDVQATDTLLGDVTQGGVKGFLAKQVLPKGAETLAAQNKVNASGVMQILNNLPPGPASDNDVKQAKSTFPGYGNAKALQDWIDNTNSMLDQKFATYQDKYGSMKWYGNTSPMQTKSSATGDFSVNENLADMARQELERRNKK
jgi:hypothetical protein